MSDTESVAPKGTSLNEWLAWSAGWSAYYAEGVMQDNPHADGNLREAWNRGFQVARKYIFIPFWN